MARVLLITADLSHAAYTNTKAALVAKGHTVVGIAESSLGSADLTGVQVIATVRATYSSDTVSNWLRDKWMAGYPILTGGTEAGLAPGSGEDTLGVRLAIQNAVNVVSNTTAANTEWMADTYAGHPITAAYPAGGNVNVLAGGNWAAFETGTPLGVRLGSFIASSGAYMTAVETGTTLKATGASRPSSGIAPARAVLCGWLYAGQTDYTADGKTILDNAVGWLVETPQSPTGPTVQWYDGATEHPATLLGWWDGSAVQPIESEGWYDGSITRPLG